MAMIVPLEALQITKAPTKIINEFIEVLKEARAAPPSLKKREVFDIKY